MLTFTSEVPVSYECLEMRGVGHVVCHLRGMNLLCNAHGYMIVEREEEEGFIEYIAPLLATSGFRRNSLIMYYLSRPKYVRRVKGFELKHVLLDSETLEPLELDAVLPEETVIANNGGGAIGRSDYELMRSFYGEKYVYQEFIPQLVRQILTKVYGEEPREWKGKVIAPLSKPALTVNIGGEEYLVLHFLIERPIREYTLERAFLELVRVLRKLRVPRGVLLMVYIERITISGFRTYTPRFFWYLLSYDRERGHLATPGII